MLSFTESKALLVESWNEWNKDEAPRLGAALSFYTMLSLAPLLILLIAIAGLVFGDEAARGQVFTEVRSLVGDQGAAAVQEMVNNASKPSSGIIATIIGFLTLLWGATTVASELQFALNKIWSRTPEAAADESIKETVTHRGMALAVVLGAGFLLLTSLAVSSMLAGAGKWAAGFLPLPEVLLTVLNLVLAMAVITGVFAVLFRYLPDARPPWADVFAGALFTSVLFAIGKYAIGVYLGKASIGSAYGAAGSLVVVLVWVYYSSQILFFGAEFTEVYSRRHGSMKNQGNQADATRHADPKPRVAERPRGEAEPAPAPAVQRSAAVAEASQGTQTGIMGTLLGSALALTRIVRGARR